jgi:hypothetical protein
MLATVLGRPDDAREHLNRALTLHRGLGAARLVRLTEAALAKVSEAATAPETASIGRGTFRREGDWWRIGLGEVEVALRDSKGLGDLARLIAEPRREFPAIELAQPTAPVSSADVDIDLTPEGDLGDVVDAAARAAYRARLTDIEVELADADVVGDSSASLRLSLERDALVEQLSQAYGLGGRARRAGDPAERARSTVTARIRDAIRKIESAEPAVGRHLSRSVRTGRFCSYDPETPVDWQL